MTLSANDNWPDLINFLKQDNYPIKPKNNDSSNLVRENPVLTALSFEKKWKALLNNVILGKEKCLGKIVDYFARVEFQNRGSPHMHMFFWVEGAPNFETGKNEEIVNFIDRYISCSLPDDEIMCELVKKVQTHKHKFACTRKHKGKQVCRFAFPKKPCSATKLLANIEMLSFTRTNFYELKRSKSESNINAYNPTILKHWQVSQSFSTL